MFSKALMHLRRQWMGALALFLVLTGGTAYAAGALDGPLPGTNQVGSLDIINGQVLSADIGSRQVKQADLGPAEAWHEVGAVGEPTFNASPGAFCSWTNFASNHDSAAFYRDPFGVVRLKGLVRMDTQGDPGFCWSPDGSTDGSFQIANRRIFTLPAGYRPTKRLTDIAIAGGHLARIDVDGPSLSGQPAGSVSVDIPTDPADVNFYLSLNGITFRCGPSGQNGCP